MPGRVRRAVWGERIARLWRAELCDADRSGLVELGPRANDPAYKVEISARHAAWAPPYHFNSLTINFPPGLSRTR
jgi:hypothetical protein